MTLGSVLEDRVVPCKQQGAELVSSLAFKPITFGAVPEERGVASSYWIKARIFPCISFITRPGKVAIKLAPRAFQSRLFI